MRHTVDFDLSRRTPVKRPQVGAGGRERLSFNPHMPKQSAGLLVYRMRESQIEVFLVHPGGPFWAKKDAGAWSIPKGEFRSDEEPLATARREFTEETGRVV